MTAASPPKVSVLIHNRNRSDCLDRCLASLGEQTIRPLEVVVLDAESTDDSLSVIATHQTRLTRKQIHLVTATCAPMGVPASRNLAACYATGELLFFMDNDATLEGSESLAQLYAYFQERPTLGLSGCQILAGDTDNEDPFCWVYRRSVAAWRNTAFETFTFAGAGFCVRATAYKQVGGFWEVIDYSREEEALALRLIDHGFDVLYLPLVVVRHYPDPRGRRNIIERRAIELKNGVLIYWHAYPAGLGWVCSLLRLASMSFRVLRRREGSLRTMLRGWSEARSTWRESALRREPVSWSTILQIARLHRSKGVTDDATC